MVNIDVLICFVIITHTIFISILIEPVNQIKMFIASKTDIIKCAKIKYN